MKVFALLIALSIGCATGLLAQDQQTMNRMASEDAEAADKELNATYKKVMAMLDSEGQELLKKSQRAWIAFRDADAAFRADEMRDGSAAPLLYYGTVARLTEERTKALREMLGDE